MLDIAFRKSSQTKEKQSRGDSHQPRSRALAISKKLDYFRQSVVSVRRFQYIMAFCHEFFVFALSISNIFINNYELQKLILLYNSGMDIKSGLMYSKLAKEFIDNITSLNK